MDIDLALDVDSLRATEDRIARGTLRAAKESVVDTTKWLERTLEDLTRASVPGRLWRAWKSDTFPTGSGLARAPAGTVYVNGGARSHGAMEFHTRPGRIQAKDGFWLAIPLPAAGSRGRQRNLTPGEWERINGVRLRFVYRPGKPALLVADEGTTNTRTGTFRRITRRRTEADMRRGFVRGAQTVPIFVLVPYVPFKNSVAIRPVLDQAPDRLRKDFDRRLSVAG